MTGASISGAAGDVPRWGSDVIAHTLRALAIPYIALNPGASYRGLHDSLVNVLDNERPHMLLFLHEEHAVACAHGYAKVTGQPMGVVLHSNVGLMHAAMAIFNAYCDRVPILLIGATGPVDAAQRRPWIDWIHTSADQAALVRPFIKWDDQPASVTASVESLLRGVQLSRTPPCAPVYICLDAAVQEAPLSTRVAVPDTARYAAPPPAEPSGRTCAQVATLLSGASKPVLLIGRVSRSVAAWNERVGLGEALGAAVITDLKLGAAFPTAHRLHIGAPGFFLSAEARAALLAADVVVALDWVDLGGTLRQAWGHENVSARVISVSVDSHLHAGWAKEYGSLAPVDVPVLAEPDVFVPLLRASLPACPPREPWFSPDLAAEGPPATDEVSDSFLSMAELAAALQGAVADDPVCLVRLPLGWSGSLWHFTQPLDYLGSDGGGGIGSGPGMSVGAALALRDTGVLPVSILGDGDFLMGITALWTAVHEKLPLLIVVANNRSYFNDELHQDRIAMVRGRNRENRAIGQRLEEPTIDLAAMARAQGCHAEGSARTREELDASLAQAVTVARSGGVAVVDAWVQRRYDSEMTVNLTRGGAGWS